MNLIKVPHRHLLHKLGHYGVRGQTSRWLSAFLADTDKKLSYRRETARQLPTWRGLSPPVHSPSPSGYPYAYGRIRNPQQTYAKRAVRKAHFKLNRAFKVIQGYPYLCQQEPRAMYCRNVQLMPPLFLKLTKIWQQEHSKFVDFNDLTQV